MVEIKPPRYAVIGNPIAHSLSPRVHQLFSEQTGCPLSYKTVEAPPGKFADTVASLIEGGYSGANITLPFKQEALAIADKIAPRALASGTANTLTFSAEQTISADSTDGAGLILDLDSLNLKLRGQHLLLIGAGGACRSILYTLLNSGIHSITVANRTPARAHNVVQDFSGMEPAPKTLQACGLDKLKQHTSEQPFDCVINTTSASLNNSVPNLPDELAHSLLWGYDLCYGGTGMVGETAFVQWLRQHGVAKAHTGIGMLVGQAAESFLIWHGVRPDIKPVIRALAE